VTKLSAILDQIDNGSILLPEFQRGYVWNGDQVRGLMRSLYRGYPVGTLLIWEAAAGAAAVRGGGTKGARPRELLLDGQQRITTLYGVVRGKPPAFFEGNAKAFQGLFFNVHNEAFEFLSAVNVDDSRWVEVTSLFGRGLGPHIARLSTDPTLSDSLADYLTRLSRLYEILNRDFHAETITDPDIKNVVDIFNRVNSGGTKLSGGDLALARLCAEWPEARATMRKCLATWSGSGYEFTLAWFLRSVAAVATGRAQFSHLDKINPRQLKTALDDTAKHIGHFLDVVRSRLGLDHDRVLMGRYAFPVICRYLSLHNGSFASTPEMNKILFWYIHAAVRGRFTSSTETTLAQDYDAVEKNGVDGLIDSLERWRGGGLSVSPQDFEVATLGSRFYPLLYMLTRVKGARDFGTGLPLSHGMLGQLTNLQVHHIFPKALLYQHGYKRDEVNAIANFCLLTQESNLKIGKRPPVEYLAEVGAKHPGAIPSQWLPEDPSLWKVERYRDFLAARRELLAVAANDVLRDLRGGVPMPVQPTVARVVVAMDDADDARVQEVREFVEFLVDAGFTPPVLDAEITDPEGGGEVLAIAEAYWPDGLQPGRGNPAVLELDKDSDLARLESLGYEVFTSVEAMRRVVQRRNDEAAGLIPLNSE
jgi:hypothetical protein